jgi:hypothetical protein
MLTPYPLIYCPKGITKPACCPHAAPTALLPGKGPDAVLLDDGQPDRTSGGGMCYGGGWQPNSPGWKKTRAGWYVQIGRHRPQDLIRLQPHPRVREWITIQGAQADHAWRIPLLLEQGDAGWTSALDGVWDGEQYHGGDLAPVQEQLLAVVRDVVQGLESPELLAAIRSLAIQILAVAQWVDEDLLIAGGFLSEMLALRAIVGAAGQGEPT